MKPEDIRHYTLPNGMKVVHIFNDSPVAYCGLGVAIGTRNELEEESGMAHFIEHCMFKGTTHRNAWHILNRLEDVGGDINAYTEKEETFVYATVLESDFERAMDLCTDIVLNPVFPQSEIDKEKEVIIDEINTYNDSPSELIYDEFESMLFSNKGLGRSVLGKEEILNEYTTEDALRFHASNYGTNKMIFFSMGRMSDKKLDRLVDKYLKSVPARIVEPSKGTIVDYKPQHMVVKKDLHQVNYMTGNRAYGLYDKNRYPFILLNNILGGPGLNSRLNLAIREKRGMSYSVESSFTPYTDCGLVSVFFSADLKHKNKCIDLVKAEINKLKNDLLSDSQLTKAKKQLMGQQAIAAENKESMALSIAKSFLYFDNYTVIEKQQELIEKITAKNLRDIANEIFDESLMSEIIYE